MQRKEKIKTKVLIRIFKEVMIQIKTKVSKLSEGFFLTIGLLLMIKFVCIQTVNQKKYIQRYLLVSKVMIIIMML